MFSFHDILNELKGVPANRFDELYQLVHAMSTANEPTESVRKKILAYGGTFSELSDKDYKDYLAHTKKTRKSLFDRDIEI